MGGCPTLDVHASVRRSHTSHFDGARSTPLWCALFGEEVAEAESGDARDLCEALGEFLIGRMLEALGEPRHDLRAPHAAHGEDEGESEFPAVHGVERCQL